MVTELLPTESSALATIQLCLWTASMFSHSSKWTVAISWVLTMGQGTRNLPWADIIPLIITKILEVGTTVSSFLKAWRSKVTYRGQCCSQGSRIHPVQQAHKRKEKQQGAARKGTEEQGSKDALRLPRPRQSLNLDTEGGSPLLPNYLAGFFVRSKWDHVYEKPWKQ